MTQPPNPPPGLPQPPGRFSRRAVLVTTAITLAAFVVVGVLVPLMLPATNNAVSTVGFTLALAAVAGGPTLILIGIIVAAVAGSPSRRGLGIGILIGSAIGLIVAPTLCVALGNATGGGGFG